MKINKNIYINNRNVYIDNKNIDMKNLNKQNINSENINQKKDKLEISKEAKCISEQIQNIEDSSREEKIQNIKNSIKDGTYTINYEELAKKIITKIGV